MNPNTTPRNTRSLIALALVALVGAPGLAVGTPTGPAALLSGLPPHAAEMVALAERAQEYALPLPADPSGALEREVAAFLSDLGFPSSEAASIREAGLSDAFAGRLANLVAAVRGCTEATQAVLERIPLQEIVASVRDDPRGLEAADFAEIQECAGPALRATTDMELVSQTEPPMPAAPDAPDNLINIWPILVVDAGGDDRYDNDYIITIELGGNDVYNNNAGSNMIDTRFAPASSPFPGVDTIPHVAGFNDGDDDRSGFGPSEGCAIALGSLLAGNCTALASVFIDMAGQDRYGVFQTPVAGIDARCTSDLVIRRMVTNGVGFLGFGVLLDVLGNDDFNGRTGSNGAGHIFGEGFLIDRAGNDDYLDVRNAQGFSLIGNLGVLLDEAGNDDYSFYMPSALVPGTPNEQEGAGGVIDDENLCDNLPRLVQGAGNAGGVGVLIDREGNDEYEGACTPGFGAPGDIGQRACSQGFGATAGIGAFADLAGNDQYSGVAGRGNDRVIALATVACCTIDPVTFTVGREVSVDSFVDR